MRQSQIFSDASDSKKEYHNSLQARKDAEDDKQRRDDEKEDIKRGSEERTGKISKKKHTTLKFKVDHKSVRLVKVVDHTLQRRSLTLKFAE